MMRRACTSLAVIALCSAFTAVKDGTLLASYHVICMSAIVAESHTDVIVVVRPNLVTLNKVDTAEIISGDFDDRHSFVVISTAVS